MEQRILFADPDEGISQLAVMVLKQEGYEVTTVQSIEEAMEALRNSSFDLIVTEAFDQSRSVAVAFNPNFLAELNSVAPSIPIILFSTWVSFYNIRRGQYGLTDVVTSMGFDELVTKVNNVLDKDSSSTH